MTGYYCVLATYDEWNRPISASVREIMDDCHPTSWVSWKGKERTECTPYETDTAAFKAMRKIMKEPKRHKFIKLLMLFTKCAREALRDGLGTV